MSVGEGDGDSGFKLLEGAGVAEFAFTSIEGAGEVDGDEGPCELFVLWTWLKSITSLPKPGLRERHQTKTATAANTTTIRTSTRKRANLVARSPMMLISEGPAAAAGAAPFLQKTNSRPRAGDGARSVAGKCKAQSAPAALTAHQTPFRRRVRRRAPSPG